MVRLLSIAPVLAAVAALSACAQPEQQPPAAEGECNAKAAQFAVGYASTDALAEEARRRSGSKLVRVLKPGQMVTMEFNSERLNLDVDEGNRVTAVRCG